MSDNSKHAVWIMLESAVWDTKNIYQEFAVIATASDDKDMKDAMGEKDFMTGVNACHKLVNCIPEWREMEGLASMKSGLN